MVGIDPNDSDFDTVLKEGGEKEHQLSEDEIPSHRHNVSGANPNVTGGPEYSLGFVFNKTRTASVESHAKGGDQPHNNLQPYIVVYRWRRVA